MKLIPCTIVLFLVFFVTTSADEPQLTETEQKEQKVVDRFWSLLEKAPRRGTSLDRVYGWYVDTGRMDELVDRCRSVTKTKPDDAKAWLLLGLVLSRRSDDAATTEAFEEARSLDKTDPLAPFYLGETYIAQGRLMDAAEALEDSLARSLEAAKTVKNTGDGDRNASARDVLAVLQTLGRVYERFGDRENSSRIWTKLEELFPGDRDILVRIAETLEEEGKFDEALSRYLRLSEMSKDDRFAKVQYTLAAADIKIRLGDKQAAIDDFEKLLEELSAESWLAQSIRDRVERIFVRQADYAGLAGYYQKRLEKHPDEIDTIRRLAIALIRLSRTDEAKKLLTATLEKAPSNIPLRLAVIDLLVADRQFDEVDRHYSKIDEIEPNNPDHVSQWGLAVMENKKLPEAQRKAAAVKIWNRLVAAKPNDPATVIMVADLMSSAKIDDEAEKLYKKAIELRPGDPSFLEYLGFFYHGRERKAEAIAALRKIAEDGRRTATTLAQLGGIFKSLGYTEESVTAYREAVEFDPKDFELRMQFATILYGNEKFDKAEKEFAAAETLAEPVSEDYARYLSAYVKLLQATGKLDDETKKLSEELEKARLDNVLQAAAKFQRLAVYQTARSHDADAVDAIEKAVELQPNSNVLLEAAAKIFERGDDPKRAVDIYRRLADADPQRRVDHLKRLANLERELGEIDKAIETARLVMATGSGNAANSRFYADMLLNVGRREDGIEALRRAVRLDPTDTTTLSYLAEALFGAEQVDEALEILWRVFERTEDLQSKIASVSRMSTYYQQSQRFDQLVERLRQMSKDAATRRESAYCLAQAYVTVSDFHAARNTLETLLLGAEAKENETKSVTDDTMLLSQLSRIAEFQGDLATAIRYQEMLCDQIQSARLAGPENERLLGLYQLGGEKNKAVDHLLRTLMENGELRDQLAALDGFLTREDYDVAETILDRIESKHLGNWEVRYRRLMLDFWTKNFDVAEKTATEIFELDLPRDELSAKKKHEEEKRSTTPSSSNTPQPRSRYSPYQGYSAWDFGPDQRHYGSSGGSMQQRWNAAANELLKTLFRERLQLERHFYNRGLSVTTEPPKPQFSPEIFEDARFAASLWKLRIALQRDLDAFRKDHPAEEGKPETVPNEENGLKLDGFKTALAELRKRFSVDAERTDDLMDQLRLELFFDTWYLRTQNDGTAFPETKYGQLLFDDLLAPTEAELSFNEKLLREAKAQEESRRLRNDLEYELTLRGVNDWFVMSYVHLISSIEIEHGYDSMQDMDIVQEFDKIVKESGADEKFTAEEIEIAKKRLLEMFETMKTECERLIARDKRSKAEKIDWLLKCWDADNKNGIALDRHTLPIMRTYFRFQKLLRREGRDEDIRRLTEAFETVFEENPWICSSIAGIAVGDLFNVPGPLVSVTSILFTRPIPSTNAAPTEADLFSRLLDFLRKWEKEKENRIDPAKDDERFETFVHWVDRAKEAALKPQQKAPNLPRQAQAFRLPADQQVDQILNQYLTARSAAIRPFCGKPLPPQPGQRMAFVAQPVMPTPSVEEGTALDKPLSAEQCQDILATEKEIRRMLNRYFVWVNELDGKVKPAEPPKRPARRVALPGISSYRHYFEHDNPLHSFQLQSILHGGQSPNVIMAAQTTEMTLSAVYTLMEKLDNGLKEAKWAEGVEPLKPEFEARFLKYIDEKKEHGTDADRKHIAGMQKRPETQPGQAAIYQNTVDVEKELKELEAKRKEVLEKGETADPKILFALSLLYKMKGNRLESMRLLDAIPYTGSGDVRLREQIALKYLATDPENKDFKERAEKALQRLRGFQLKEDELIALRQTYNVLGKKEEADKILERLLVSTTSTHTQYNLMQELQNAADSMKEKAVQFALKVYRSPAMRTAASRPNHDMIWHLRNQCIEVLRRHGKLGEIIEQIEVQLESAPGSLDLMMAMADIYQKANRKDDAKRVARQMAELIPDDAQKMQNYANLLNNIEMKTEAAEWMQKSLAKNPELMLQNFWQYDNMFRENKQIPKLIELLKTIKPQRLASSFGQFGYRVADWLNNKEHGDAARDLLKYVWDMEGASETEKRNARLDFVRNMVFNANHAEFYPMFRTVVFDYISSADKNDYPSSGSNPFAVNHWSSNKGGFVAGTFLDLAEKQEGVLDALDKEIQAVIETHEKIDAAKRNQTALTAARLLLVMVEARKKNVDRVVELFEPLRDEQLFKTLFTDLGGGMAVAQELNLLDHPKTARWALEYFEAELNRNHGSSYVKRIIMPSLYRLYMKTDEKEKGRKLALERLRESFKYLKLAGNNYSYQVGNIHYSTHDLQEMVLSMSKLLIENDAAFDVMLVYREMYDGQKWVDEARKRYNYRYNEIDRISRELGEKATLENFAENLERLIPEATDEDIETCFPLLLGDYILPVKQTKLSLFSKLDLLALFSKDPLPEEAQDGPSPVGIRLADALKTVAETDSERYGTLAGRLEELDRKFPEEPTVMILVTCRRLIDGNRNESAALLRRLAEWAKKQDVKANVSDAVYLGCWHLVRETFGDAELIGSPEVRKDTETLFFFTGRLIGRNMSRELNNMDGRELARSLVLDMKRHVPPELMEKFKPVFSGEMLGSILFDKSGAVTQNLSGRYNVVGDQLADAVSMHAAEPVMDVLRKTFRNGWPRIENNASEAISRANALYLLIVYEKAMRAVRKSETDPEKIFTSLQSWILPWEQEKPPFIADYADLGGLNGYYRSPLIDLVEYAVTSRRTGQLEDRIKRKRSREYAAPPSTEEVKLRLDAVEFALALRKNDTEKIETWKKSFREAIGRGENLSAKYALIVAVPFAKPYEDTEVDGEKFSLLIDLIDAAVSLKQNGEPCRRYTYYAIKSFYETFAETTDLDGRIRWLRRFRDIDDATKMNGFRFTMEDRLYREGMKNLDDGKLAEAVSVLKFFADCPVEQFRYRDLTDYLAELDKKLGKLSETKKKELLGDFPISRISKRSTAKREPGRKELYPAPEFELPKLPEGKIVYQNDFETETGPAWSIDRRDTIPKIQQTFLGDFFEEPVRFQLKDLPEHRFVRIRFDLLMLGGFDGLVGQPRDFGVDVWSMEIDGRSKPIAAAFSNYHKDPNNQKQTFPDDYPPEFGSKPSWYGKVTADDLWGDELEKGYYFGRHGAFLENVFGYEKDSLYAVDLLVPHDAPELTIDFYAKLQDGPFGAGSLNKNEGESWGLDNFQVEVIDKPLELDAGASKKCFEFLVGDHASKAHAARWRLVAAENASVEFIGKWFDENREKAKSIREPGNFDLFRIDRVLELIGTPEAETLRGKIKP